MRLFSARREIVIDPAEDSDDELYFRGQPFIWDRFRFDP